MWTSRSEGLALLLVLVLVGAGCDDDDSRPAPAHPTRAADRESGAPDFAVVADVGDQVAIVDADGTVRPVAGVRADFDVDFAVLDADRIAFVSDERVGVLNGDGTVTDQECPGCHGIAVTDAGIVTAQDNFQPGFGFDVVVLDDALHEVSRGPAERVAERPIDSTTAPDQSPVVLLGATATQAYVGYLSRTGGVRQGPWVIAAHDLDGRRTGVAVENGKLYGHRLSPDGRYLALSVGGNGGACVTSNHLAVIDTRTMTDLGTDPLLPAGLGVTTEQSSEAWFQSAGLFWSSGPDGVVATDHGGVHRPDGSGCDPRPEIYQRRYDPATETMSDSGPVERAQVGWFGTDCGTGLFLTDPTPEMHLLAVTSAGPVDLPRAWTRVLAAPSPPRECAA